MIVDGKKIAEEILQELEEERQGLPPILKLGVVVGRGDESSASFVRIKERVAERLRIVVVREEIQTTEQALRAIDRLYRTAQGIIVQLPLPAGRQGSPGVDTERVLQALPKERDIDFTNAPVAMAVEEVLKHTKTKVKGKKAVVVGYGRLVGAPAAELLKRLGAKVTVLQASDPLLPLAEADIVVLGAGSPGLVQPEMLKKGVVLIDAGTSESQGKVVGDAAPECAEVASFFTPVPGGIGPIAVAMIFRNLFTLAKAK